MPNPPSARRLGRDRRFFRSSWWIAAVAAALVACSGALTEYTSSVAPSPEVDRPLIEARRCLETFGFEMKIVDVRAGLVSGETFGLAEDRHPAVVVSEVSVVVGGDSVRIIARSRRASSGSGGWEPVRIPERVRETVDRLADRLDGTDSRAGGQCDPIFVHEGDDVARGPDVDRRGGAPSVTSTASVGVPTNPVSDPRFHQPNRRRHDHPIP